MSHDDIRQRLAAVEHIDWSYRRKEGEEYYGTWDEVGPAKMLATNPDYEPWHAAPSMWPSARRQEYSERAQGDRDQEEAVVAFLQHAAGDLRRLLAALDHATTTREAIMPTTSSCPDEPNAVYGPPTQGEPVRLLADAVEVLRPNGTTVAMDLVALADVAIKADRAVAELREENRQLRERLDRLESRVDDPRSALTRAADAVEARLNELERGIEEVERQRGRRDG